MAAFLSLSAFGAGAIVPLAPWFFADGNAALLGSVVLALAAAVAIGTVIARFTETSVGWTVARQLVFTVVPCVLTYAIGTAVGVGLD